MIIIYKIQKWRWGFRKTWGFWSGQVHDAPTFGTKFENGNDAVEYNGYEMEIPIWKFKINIQIKEINSIISFTFC